MLDRRGRPAGSTVATDCHSIEWKIGGDSASAGLRGCGEALLLIVGNALLCNCCKLLCASKTVGLNFTKAIEVSEMIRFLNFSCKILKRSFSQKFLASGSRISYDEI